MRTEEYWIKRLARRIAVILIAGLGVLTILASTHGSSSNGEITGPFSNASLSGSYAVVTYGHSNDSTWNGSTYMAGAAMPNPTEFFSSITEITFDGEGNYSLTFTENEDGTITSGADTGTYSVSPSGAITIDDESFGQLTGTADTFVAAQLSEGEDPEIGVFIKKDGIGLTVADLDGEYFFAGYEYDPDETQDNAPAAGMAIPAPKGFIGFAGTISFDGLGQASVTGETENLDGTVSALMDEAPFPYTVSATGNVVLDGDFRGVMRGDGEILIFSQTNSNESPEIFIAIRKGEAPFTADSMNGEFAHVFFGFESDEEQPLAPANGQPIPPPAGFNAVGGLLSFDSGSGIFFGTETSNTDGVIEDDSFGPELFTVGVDGTVTLDGEARGFLSSDGNILLYSPMANGSDPGIMIGVRP